MLLRLNVNRLICINRSVSQINKINKRTQHIKPLQINQNLLREFDFQTGWNWYRSKDSLLHDALKHDFLIQQAKCSDTNNELELQFKANKGLSGHPNIVHGGFIASAMCESMGVMACKFINEYDNVITASLDTNYLLPLKVGQGTNTITVKIDEKKTDIAKRKIYVESELRNYNGEIVSIANGLYIQTAEKTNEIIAQLAKEYNQQRRREDLKNKLLIGLGVGFVLVTLYTAKIAVDLVEAEQEKKISILLQVTKSIEQQIHDNICTDGNSCLISIWFPDRYGLWTLHADDMSQILHVSFETKSIVTKVFKTQKMINIKEYNIGNLMLKLPKNVSDVDIKNCLCTPIMSEDGNNVIGVIQLLNKYDSKNEKLISFTKCDEQKLLQICETASTNMTQALNKKQILRLKRREL
eukprot:535394_1